MQNHLINHFDRYFQIVPANTPELLLECHKLRFQVFCVENNYLSDNAYERGSEVDEYDERSVHSLILHKDSGVYAATVRLVLPTHKKSIDHYPMESHLSPGCRQEYNRLMNAPRDQLAEISRLLVSKHFRQRLGESDTIDGLAQDFGILSAKMKRQLNAQISLGLFKAIVQMSAKEDIFYWIAMMEPRLIRLLARIGIHFNHLSTSIKYCGDRHICFENGNEVLLGIKRQRPDIWEFITDSGGNSLTLPATPVRHKKAETKDKVLPQV